MDPESRCFEALLAALIRAICTGDGRIGFCELEDGLIRRYSEEFDRAPVLAKLEFSDDRIAKSVRRWAKK